MGSNQYVDMNMIATVCDAANIDSQPFHMHSAVHMQVRSPSQPRYTVSRLHINVKRHRLNLQVDADVSASGR